DGAGNTQADSGVVSFNPLINSKPIYPAPIYQISGGVTANEPYLMQRHKLKGSCITSVDDFNYNFTWIQSFEAPYNLRESSPLDPFDPDVYIDGVPLTNTIKWENDITFAG